MKPPVGHGQPRRKPAPRKQVRLDLRPTKPRSSPEDEIEQRQKSSFWKWFALVALFHFLVLVAFVVIRWPSSPPPPTPPMISLMPEGDTVKGTPGQQSAPKVGATTPAPVHHSQPQRPTPPAPVTPPPPAPTAVQPPPKPIAPKQVIHDDHAPLVAETKPKPKPAPPKPKVKVDLTLEDGPTPAPEKHVTKPKQVKKTPPPTTQHDNMTDQDTPIPKTMGLSKFQIAQRLGDKTDAAGTCNATESGVSGAHDGHANNFSDFYASIHDQVMDKWQHPDLDDPQAVNPIVQIHVEKDGHVPPERVTLLTSSGNPGIDDSALQAARSLGYLLQPLPDGCPPDISITFKLTH